jgi:glycosyltransferase involved in cell wall biosynthesis
MSETGGQRAVGGGRVVMFTPMPPTRTGVAHYASMLAPALAKHMELEVIDSPSAARRPLPTDVIYQLGNNPHHAFAYRAAMEHPGVIVLHDIVLHHLIVEMTLAQGDLGGYVAALAASHGEVGAAWARGRAVGLHSEMGNFLLPASIDVANRSRAVIVHNRYSADRLRSFGVRTPIHVVPHPYQPHPEAGARREEIRARHGFTATNRVIGLFGFLTSAKRSEVVLNAFREARADMPDLRLLVVGEAAPNIDVTAFGGQGITFTGYVPDDDFPAYFAAVDRLVNLRYPTAGETSGTLIRAFEAGKPVAVSDYAQFAELPDDCVVKIPFGEAEFVSLADFFFRELPDPSETQHRWLEKNARLDMTVDGYLNALRAAPPTSAARIEAAVPLFPKLEVVERTVNTLTIRNSGDTSLRARQYGQPGYRLLVNGRWLELPGDLAPREVTVIELPPVLRGVRLELVHAIQGIPLVEPEAWERVEVH